MKMPSFTERPDHLHSPNTRECLVLGNSAVLFFSIIILDKPTLQEFPGKIVLVSCFFFGHSNKLSIIYMYTHTHTYISL